MKHFTKDQVATVSGILREQADRRRRGLVGAGTGAMVCGCRKEGSCSLCRPIEELEEIIELCDDRLWEMDKHGIFRAWRKIGKQHPLDKGK